MVSPVFYFGVQVILPTLIWSLVNFFAEFVEGNLKYEPETSLERWASFDLPRAFIGVSLSMMVTNVFTQSRNVF